MQGGLIIEYRYEGDEAPWRAAIESFIGSIRADKRLSGAFTYQVMRDKKDAARRVHIPRWKDEETLKHVQSQAWFTAFADKVKAFAGESLKTTPITPEFDSVV